MITKPTNARLLDVAVDHFGRLGLDGASTRAIARDSDTQMSSITYHFGGKDGLYLATADHIAGFMRSRIAPILDHATTLCEEEGDIPAARGAIHAMVGGIAYFMLHEERRRSRVSSHASRVIQPRRSRESTAV